MLKHIPAILSPDLLRALCAMGHTDELVLADANFAAETIGRDAVVVRADGHSIPSLLNAILELMPLDTYVEYPISLMETPPDMEEPPIWRQYRQVFASQGAPCEWIHTVEYNAFYEQARHAAVVVATGEKSLYANIILRKGIVK